MHDNSVFIGEQPGAMAHTCNPSTWQSVQVDRLSPGVETPAWATW